jgi:multidrug efflux system membrane fusion protein
VQRASFGTFVYVVKDDRTVTIRRIALGPAENDRVSIQSGLAANERIVLEGVDDLTEGAKVDVIADSTPADPRRTPGDSPAVPAANRQPAGRRP